MKRIVRSFDEKYIGGVCGGIAKAFDVDPALIRMIFVFLTILSGLFPGIVTYLFGWGITPVGQNAAPFKRWLPKREKGIPTEKVNVSASFD